MRGKWRGTLALVALLGLTGCAAARMAHGRSDQATYGSYLRGLLLERSAKFPEALDAYRLALERDSGSPLLHVRLGATYVKLGQPERALQAFAQALAINPQQPDALRWTAMLYTSQGQIDRAVDTYERLLALGPTDQFVMSTLADLYVLEGELPKAIDVYHRLIGEAGSSSQLHFNLGVLHGRRNEYPDALAELSKACELEPDSVEIRVALGLTYELSGQYSHAAPHYEEAIRRDPLNAKLYYHAGRAHFNAKEYAAAISDYQAALDLAPQDFEAIMGLVRTWMAQRRYADAQRFLGEKLAELNNPPELYVALGLVYREADQAQEALRAFERASDVKPDYAQAHFYLASQLDQLGRRADARAALRRTIALDPNHSDALNYLGYLDAEDGVDLVEAKALIERALAIEPDNGAYLDSLGWVYYQQGQTDQAIDLLLQAAKALDSDPTIFDHLGDAYARRREMDRARANWERALSLGGNRAVLQEKLNRIEHEAMTAR